MDLLLVTMNHYILDLVIIILHYESITAFNIQPFNPLVQIASEGRERRTTNLRLSPLSILGLGIGCRLIVVILAIL